jgi:hypothetical protein
MVDRLMSVLVFSTSIQTHREVIELAPLLNHLAGPGSWTLDLDDCDKVLRIIRTDVCPQQTIQLLQSLGYSCEELED